MTSNNYNGNNNNEENERIENIKNKIDKLKSSSIENKEKQQVIQLSSRPTYAIGGLFAGTAIYYNIQNKKKLAMFSLFSSGLFMLSGHLIDNGNENLGSNIAGGISAILSGTTLASSFKNKKILPLTLGSIAVASMGYHAFFSLYNNLDQVKSIVDEYNENVKLTKQQQSNNK